MVKFAVAATFLAAAVAGVAGDFYPDGHFDHVTQITDKEHLDSFVSSNIAEDKTVFVRWIASTG